MKRLIIAAAAITAAYGLSACETATPYQALTPATASSGGYSDTKIEANRWKVGFAGNGMTARDTVETYLLYRAAELTVNQGFDWFETVDRQTDKHTQTYVDPVGPGGPYGFGWHPYWRYYRGGFGWRGWDPYGGDPFWANDVDVQTVERYETSTEIVMGHGAKPVGDPHAFDAREVMSNLAGKIVKPAG
jgi:hypothetical protein